MAEEVKKENKSKIASREEEILAFWQKEKIFQKSLEKRSPKGNYVFYDGPPFATGLPHYGHILGSAIKDAVPRYQTMRGFHVERRWGWDCHGLPIENIVEKDLKISGKVEIETLGIEKFNEYARSKVLTYVHDWKKTVDRIGRWVDFDGSYKTMDNSYIESVWWALKEINSKKLLYEGVRVLPYCPRCETPIANSEIAMDGSYKDITDISVYVKFELADEPGTYLLAWTTTPWTLPGNTAAAVNSELTYVKVRSSAGSHYIFAKDKLEAVSKLAKEEKFEVVEEFKGKKLVGKSYKPIFDYFANKPLPNKENGWKVYAADYVTADAGTGIVHLAPVYGEEDMALAKKEAIPFIRHVGNDGKFTAEVGEFAGLKAKPKDDHQSSDILIIKNLAHRGILFAKEKIIHSYPHCFRCETPLYYYAIPAWFIKISEVKKKLLKLNEKINWIPEHLKEGRFRKSMEGAPDWNISRNRFWASPLPIWKCDHCEKTEILGSLDELKKKTSRKNAYFLLRHGEAEQNVAGLVSCNPADPYHLTEKGKSQALAAAKSLSKKKIDIIFISDFIRTRETAEIVRQHLGLSPEQVIVDTRLREDNIGPEYAGKTWHEYHEKHSFEERLETPPHGGESLYDVKKRATDFLFDIDSRFSGKNILVVSHDTPLTFMSLGAAHRVRHDILSGYERRKEEPFYFDEPGELRELSFAQFPHNANYELDFHRPYIDEMKWKCECGKGTMARIPEVIDCWFESGSMPFAANHYPFENEKKFKQNFPAQFISEYIAQTRTWFYYTHAVSTMLFKSIAFENVVTTGTILAEDGEKMSKSKNNYSDPAIVFDKYGVDALRFYLLSSPLMKSEDLNFSEKDLDAVSKKVILRLDNVLSFFELYPDASVAASDSSTNVLDQWVVALLRTLVAETTEAMEKYEIERALRPIDTFVDDLSTWYIRRSRDRFKSESAEDKKAAIATTRFVLREFSKIIAPFMPFIAEEIYKKTKGAEGKESVHLEDWPKGKKADKNVLEKMAEVRKIVSMGLEARSKAGHKVRQPLALLTVKGAKLSPEFTALIKDEVNVKEVAYDAHLPEEVRLDTVLTDALREEGEMRDLVRAIQEFRKNQSLMAAQKIHLSIRAPKALGEIVRKFETEIKAACGLSSIKISEGEFSLSIG